MINFDEKKMIANADYIYNQREKIEMIADELCNRGFDLLFFTSSGGSMAMMEPFKLWIQQMSDLPTDSMISADMLLMGCKRLSKHSIAFLTSKSGDTKETVEAAKYLKTKGVQIVSVCGVENSHLEHLSDYCIVYKNGRPQELIFYLLIGKILYNKGFFAKYLEFADDLKGLGYALCQVRKQADQKCLDYAKKYHNEPYNIWIGSGDLWPTAYSYSMCVLEESQWIRTKSVTSAEFFHGTIELVDTDVCVTLLLTEGVTRPLDERVKRFIEKHSNKVTCFDVRDYHLPNIHEEFRKYLSPVIMAAVLQRIGKNMEVITEHSLDIRRYYRKEAY